MRLKMYLRGLGLGIIVTTLIVSAGKSGRAAELSDEEIKTRAKALGMVEEDEMLLSQASELAEEAAKNEVKDENSNDAAMSPVSADTLSGNANVTGSESLSESGIKKAVSADTVKNAKNDGKTSELKSAGAESALDHSVKNSEKKDDKSEDTKEAGLDAGKAALSSSTDKKTSSSSDKKTSSSSDKKTSSSSDKKTSSSSDKKTSSSSDKKKTSSSSKASETAAETQAPVEVQAPEADGIPAAQTEGAGEPLPSASAALSVTIVKGESSTAVAKKLQAAGIVADAMQFDQYLCLNGYDRHLVTGAHTIPAGASPRDIAEIITSR
ncbi:MAG: hypothetical protein IJ805_02795 [Lachnospiraceae bacterium]|nr:hypothetical protein [Lachnospiraceae bacterium]